MPGALFKNHMATKYRGAQVAPNTTCTDVTAVALEGANIIRYQFNPNYWDESMMILDNLIHHTPPTLEIVLNVHRPYDGTNPVTDPIARTHFKSAWVSLATKYRTEDKIFAYGILNEPAGSGQQVNNFMLEIHDAIRSVDLLKRIAVTCPYSDPTQFSKTRFIKGDSKVWYEVHMYQPMSLTHQGISGRPYPKPYPSSNWNKNKLIYSLRHVREFQLEHKARIYVGEFGFSTFGTDDSRANYYSDCISIFEKYGWNWTAHAWREAPVWTLESPLVLPVFQKAWQKNA